MVVVQHRKSPEVDRCDNCGAVWFDAKELREVRTAAGESSKAQDIIVDALGEMINPLNWLDGL